ncbi:MAG: transglutaminase N-terminal domain-containing protein [Pirellulaceae bacterium]
MKYHVFHGTSYGYTQPVSLCHNQVHLTPRNTGRQRCLKSSIDVSPVPSNQNGWSDLFGNQTTFFSVETPHEKLSIVARSEVEVDSPFEISPAETPPWETIRQDLPAPQNEDSLAAAQFCTPSTFIHHSAEAREYGLASFPPGRPIAEALLDLTGRIFHEFKYDQNATGVFTKPAEVFQSRRGVCQDFAHLQISCLRSLGLAARYVSGYLVTEPPPGKPKLVGADASHAWLSVYCGSAGWIDLDPTNNLIPGMRHITLAWGRDYADVCPIQGVLIGGGQSTLSVAVDVVAAKE